MQTFDELIAAADPAELLVAVDRLTSARDWDGLVQLAAMCDHAVELGRQLWPITMHIEYRLALQAPGRIAASVCKPGAARFALGPLTEVVATRHTWDQLEEWLVHPATRAAVACERVIRGEDLRSADVVHELPAALADFEGSYALPTYDDRRAAFPAPAASTRSLPPPQGLDAGADADVLGPDAACRALAEVVDAWTTQSRGDVRTAHVEGTAQRAVAALTTEAAVLPIPPHEAMAMLQWAGASGGAYGHRRGGSAGRFSAWWAAAALTGVDWPDDVDDAFSHELDAAVSDLDWYRFTTPADEPGWKLRLAVADPVDGLAWAIDATDARDDDVEYAAGNVR